jgi:hypothetical protein
MAKKPGLPSNYGSKFISSNHFVISIKMLFFANFKFNILEFKQSSP